MSDLAPIEILYVEDNPQDAELTMRALRKAAVGNRIEWVRDGAEALEFLFQQGRFANRANGLPRLMLLDLKMPKVSGLEVLERIKADERFREMPIVVLTSSGEEPDIRECYRQGVNSYIVKPVDFANFSEAVARVGLYWIAMNRTAT